MAFIRPRWWSEITSWVPPSPRSRRVRRNCRPEVLRLGVADRAAQHLPAPVGGHAGGDHHGLGDHPGALAVLVAADAGLAVRGVQEHVGERLLAQVAGVERGHVGVQLGADPRDLTLGDPRLGAQRGDQVVDLAGGDAVHVGLHHHRVQRHVDPPPRREQGGEERPGAGLGDLDRQVPSGRGDGLVPGPVAVGRAGLGAFVRVGADVLGRLGVDQGLQDRVQQLCASADRHRRCAAPRSARAGQTCPGPSRELSFVSSLVGTHKASRGGPLMPGPTRSPNQEPDLHHPRDSISGGREDASAKTPLGARRALKHARYALWKNPENLTSRQAAKLAWIAKTDPRLHRAYLLKEGLRLVFQSASTKPSRLSTMAHAGPAAAASPPSSTSAPHRQPPRLDPRHSRARPVQRPASNRSTPRSA